jgi:hypothetical protein
MKKLLTILALLLMLFAVGCDIQKQTTLKFCDSTRYVIQTDGKEYRLLWPDGKPYGETFLTYNDALKTKRSIVKLANERYRRDHNTKWQDANGK